MTRLSLLAGFAWRVFGGAIKLLSLALILAFAGIGVIATSPAASAGVTDLVSWGTNALGTVTRVNGAGIIAPASALGATIGNATHQFSGVYGNTPTGATINCTNTTLTATNVGLVYAVNMSGNHTLTLPTASLAGAGATITLLEVCNKTGATGNWTINATTGNINLVDTMAVTNTSGATGNVSRVVCTSNGTGWFAHVVRKP